MAENATIRNWSMAESITSGSLASNIAITRSLNTGASRQQAFLGMAMIISNDPLGA